MKLCLPCRSFRPASLAVCDRCEAVLVEPDDEHLARLGDLLARDRVSALIASWTRSGLVAPKLARKLSATLPHDLTLDAPAPPPEAPPPPPEALPPPPVAHVVHRHHDDAQHAGDAAASLFAAPSVTHGALDALASLDAPEHHAEEPHAPSRWESEVRPLLYENIGWFIGTLFVLAGSVYGVREAWRTLGGVPRHLLVASALLAYHAGFVGLARLLASRSASTGRVLGGIALGGSGVI